MKKHQLGIGMALVGLMLGCQDPVAAERIAALGPEQSGVPRGPTHRPGQPCTLCHNLSGGAPAFALAGTVFVSANSRQPVEGAVVQVIESNGRERYLRSNSVGNFYIGADDWTPSFPLWTRVAFACSNSDQVVSVDMQTPIFRASACAECHADPAGPSRVGHLYLTATAAEFCR